MSHAGGELAEQAGRLAARAEKVALCLDVDGTLSPIVLDPEAARPLEGMVELLGGWPPGSQPSRWSRAARPTSWPSTPARLGGYLGLYGLQEIRDGQVRVDPRLEAGRPAVQAARQDLRDHPAVQVSGAWLEDKRYAVAVRTRRVADPDRWAGPIDQAAREIATSTALRGSQGSWSGSCTPRVALRSAEAPERLLADADLVVDGPPGLRDFLEGLTAPPGSS